MEFFDENNNKVWNETFEVDEQEQAQKYIRPEAIVLELGARYGTVSCIISKKLTNSMNLVVVEPDKTVWDALENNMKKNNCNFNIVKGVISTKKLTVKDTGYNTKTVSNNSSEIPNFSLEEIETKYNLKFDTLVADCEGCIIDFFNENPKLYNQLKMIMIEHDNNDTSSKSDYDLLTQKFKENKFIEIENKENGITRTVWEKKQNGGKRKKLKTRKQKKNKSKSKK
jgi:FkbM family methyltransferase